LELEVVLETKQERRPLKFKYNRMVNAGYVGKNQEELRRHIQELAEKGIPGPTSTPTLYPVVCTALTTESVIEVFGSETSGEVEYVLLVVSEDEIYVGLGSAVDHPIWLRLYEYTLHCAGVEQISHNRAEGSCFLGATSVNPKNSVLVGGF
jgi:hypothetical protein